MQGFDVKSCAEFLCKKLDRVFGVNVINTKKKLCRVLVQ